MLLAVHSTPSVAVHAREDESWQQWQSDIQWTERLLYNDATRQLVSEFVVGDTRYRPLERLQAYFEPPTMGLSGRFVVSGFSAPFIGRANNIDDARRDWELQIDLAIQRLLATEDFERTNEDSSNLETLSRYFDLSEIRYSSPLKQRTHGRVVSVYPRPWRIQWVDGTKDTLSREQLPAELVAFVVGQNFDAVLERDPKTWELNRIVSAFPTIRIPDASKAEAEILLEGIPKSTEQPQLDWE